MFDVSSSSGLSARQRESISRRRFLGATGLGLVGSGLVDPFDPRRSHVAASETDAGIGFGKAKSVIILFLYGAPSQMDTLDP